MTNLATAEFGASLRRARERRGLSTRQVADATKLSPIAIKKLESGSFSSLPGGIYLRSMVRAYAKLVELDPEDVVQQLTTAHPEATAESGEDLTRHSSPIVKASLSVTKGARRLIFGS